MSIEHVEELIAMYALGALPREERQAVGRHLAGCESCRALAAEALGAVRVLPLAAEPVAPAPEMKQRLMARIQADLAANRPAVQPRSDGQAANTSATPRTAAASPARPRAEAPKVSPPTRVLPELLKPSIAPLRFRWAWASAAMAAMALVVVLGWWGLMQQNELATARAQLELFSRPDVRVVTIPPAKPGQTAQAKLFVAPDSSIAVLAVNGFQPLPSQQTYEFWLIRNGQALPAGTFNVSAGGSGRILVQSSEPLGQFDQAGITVEKAGGTQTPTLEALVVVGSLR